MFFILHIILFRQRFVVLNIRDNIDSIRRYYFVYSICVKTRIENYSTRYSILFEFFLLHNIC